MHWDSNDVECLAKFVFAQGQAVHVYDRPYWFIHEPTMMQLLHYNSSINVYQKTFSLLHFRAF